MERFFVAGILHDLGKLILYQQCPGESRTILEEARTGRTLVHMVERKVLGFDHGQVGEALLAQWHMPPSLREALRYHHSPRRASRYPVETASVHVADILANALRFGHGGESLVPPLSPEGWDALAIDPGYVPSLVEEVDRQFQAAVHLVGLEPGG